MLLLWGFRVYRTSRTHQERLQAGRILAGNVIALLTAASVLYLFRLQEFSRGVLALYFIFSITALIVKRAVVQAVLRCARSRGYNLKHMLVIGGGEMAQRYIRNVESSPWLGIHVADCFPPDENLLSRLEKRLHGAGIDEVILALEPDEIGVIRSVVEVCEKCGTKICVIPFYNDVIPTRPTIDMVGEIKSCLCLSNLGRVELPEAMAPYVERMDFIIGVPAKAHYNCGVVSWNGTMNVNFIRNVREPELESHFYRVLHRLGLPVKAESNQRR